MAMFFGALAAFQFVTGGLHTKIILVMTLLPYIIFFLADSTLSLRIVGGALNIERI